MAETFNKLPEYACFLTQGTDGAQHLGLINAESLRSVFVLNILFFDSIAIGASDILGNPLFNSMFMEEKDAMSKLYRNTDDGGYGVLRPVLMGEHENMESVASSIIDKQVIYSMSEGELRAHSELIDDTKPEYLWCPESYFRTSFHNNMIEATSRINTTGLQAWSNREKLLPIGSLSALAEWLQQVDTADQLQCSSIWRFADNSLSGNLVYKVKVLAEAIYQFTLSQRLCVSLSAPGAYAPVIDLIHSISSTENTEERTGHELKDYGAKDTRLSLPLEPITNLSLAQIIEVRNLPAFCKVRRLLFNSRTGLGRFRPKRLISTLEECADQLNVFAIMTESQRRDFLRRHRKSTSDTIVRVISDSGNLGLLVGLLSVDVPTYLAVLITSMSAGTSRYLRSRESGSNIVIPGEIEQDLKYDPRTGTTDVK